MRACLYDLPLERKYGKRVRRLGPSVSRVLLPDRFANVRTNDAEESPQCV